MLTIFASFVVGIVIGRMKFVILSRSLMTIVLLFAVVFSIWALSNPKEAGHWAQYYSYQLFGVPHTAPASERKKS